MNFCCFSANVPIIYQTTKDITKNDLDTTSKSFSSFLNVLAVSINVACNSENQCFYVAKILLFCIGYKFIFCFKCKKLRKRLQQ